jgi:transcriptional antiterminator NusG
MAAQTSAPPGAQWFALHTLSGQEGKVKTYIEKFKKAEELDDHIFEILLPTEVVPRSRAARSHEGPQALSGLRLHPGEALRRGQKLINKPWYFVKETTGVIGFVGGDRPRALRQSEIDEI